MKQARAKASRTSATLELETALRAGGFRHVAGVDEAGRGPLAGPVAAAAVILDPARPIDGLADSKLLSEAERERLFGLIIESACVGLSFAPAAEVDSLNIRGATLAAMRRSVLAISNKIDFILVDGRDIPPGLPCPARAVIGGDGVSASIAAASIIAKVMRDRLMKRMEIAYPGYGFGQHAGYGTPLHKAGIAALGACPLHRLSFAPFKNGTHGAGRE